MLFCQGIKQAITDHTSFPIQVIIIVFIYWKFSFRIPITFSQSTTANIMTCAGPGCSSLGAGAMMELGPFRVNKGGYTLYRNEYAWNNGEHLLNSS